MIAVIAGASGLVGSHLLNSLLDDAFYTQIIAVSRTSLNLEFSKLTNLICKDFTQLDLYTNELKGDIYFCCLGTTIKAAKTKENFKKVDYDAVVNFAQIAKSNQALKFIVISASGASPDSSIFYNKTKGQAEEKLQELKMNCLIIFKPGLLMGERIELRRAEKFSIEFLKRVSSILPDYFIKTISTSVERLCERMILESKDNAPSLKTIHANEI